MRQLAIPHAIAVSQTQAQTTYPHLCAYTAKTLRAAHIIVPAALLTALDHATPEAGDLLSRFEQNHEGPLPQAIHNMWRVITAYADIIISSNARGVITTQDDEGNISPTNRPIANGVMPWMNELAQKILDTVARADHDNPLVKTVAKTWRNSDETDRHSFVKKLADLLSVPQDTLYSALTNLETLC